MSREEQISSQENSNASEIIKVSCRYCKGTNLLKRGFRKTQNRGLIQRYYCRDCKKRFVVDNGFFRMRNSPEKITFSLDAYFRGMSLRKLQENLAIFQTHNASHMTILRWIRKYCGQIGRFTNSLKLNIGNEISFDEMEYKTKKQKSWFIDVLDHKTRYMIASGYYLQRGQNQLMEVLISSKEKIENQATDIYTDGLQAYPKLLRKIYGLNKYAAKSKIRHHVIVTSKEEGRFNWKIERLHNSVRERTKILRQFKSLESAKTIMQGYEIFYNFCRKHQAIKCYPYELATDLKLGQNKWLDLICLSKFGNFPKNQSKGI